MTVKTEDSLAYIDPAEAAANVVALVTEKYGIPEDRAIVGFMKSGTFRLLTEDQSVAKLPPEELLRIYEKEVGKP